MDEIEFRQQVSHEYSAAACVQMITGSEDHQQDIYFKMLRIMQALSPRDYANKSPAWPFTKGARREKICKMFEESINFYRYGLAWDLKIGGKLESAPGIAILSVRPNNPMVGGHPVVVTAIDGDKITVFDPSNEEQVSVLRMRFKPLVYYYFTMVSRNGEQNLQAS